MEAKKGWDNSASAWIRICKGDTNRTHLLDPAMLECIGDVRGVEVADIGCGEGRFCRMLSERGAVVTGLDLTPALVDEAVRQDPAGRYFVGNAETLPIASGHFDLTISYLVLVDVPDYRSAIREMV